MREEAYLVISSTNLLFEILLGPSCEGRYGRAGQESVTGLKGRIRVWNERDVLAKGLDFVHSESLRRARKFN